MVATRKTDDAIRKFYRELGYADYKSDKKPLRDLDGLTARWYEEGFNAKYPWWDIEPQ